MKKKLLALLISLSMILCFTACGASEEPADEPAEITGGWVENTDLINSDFPDDLNDYFNSAIQVYNENVGDGTTYEPVSLLGTMADSGTQYVFFCKTDDEACPQKTMSFAIDEEGNVGFVTVSDFDIADYTSDNPAVEQSGEIKWEVYGDQPEATLPEDAKAAFDGAFDESSNVSPVAYLGSQIVSGTNYAYLCSSNIGADDAAMQVIVVYADLDGNYEVTSTYNLDLSQY